MGRGFLVMVAAEDAISLEFSLHSAVAVKVGSAAAVEKNILYQYHCRSVGRAVLCGLGFEPAQGI